jgi:hypothetical protein
MGNTGEVGTRTQEEFETMITEQLASGKSRMEVVGELVLSGITEPEANQATERIYFQMKKSASEEEYAGEVLPPAILGGVIAAVVSGVVWAAIAIWTGYEVGYVAWGVGLLCGLGVVLFARGKKGMPLQIVAVVTSVLGIVIGKYGTAQYDYQQWLIEEGHGATVAAQYSLFSGDMMQVFAENLPNMMSGYDLLWVGLAVYTAWSIPKASGLKI